MAYPNSVLRIKNIYTALPKWGNVWDWENIFLDFFGYLNTLHPSIKWTNETEKDNKIAIFDILILRTELGYATTVYRKPAASDRYFHYTSVQAWKGKASAIYTLKERPHEYCSNETLLADELSYLLQVFIQNGYPENTVWRILYQDKREKQQKEPFDVAKALYVLYHPRARRLYKVLQEDFGLTISYKKT